MGQDDNHWCELGFAERAVVFNGPTQNARVRTEGWISAHLFCPGCGAEALKLLPNNAPVGDFACAACAEEFELKAKNGRPGAKVLGGAYSAMTARLKARNNPNLLLMSYDRDAARVTDLIVVPKQFFASSIIEPKALTWPKGRSAPSQGCNILIGKVPVAGKISLIREGRPVTKATVLEQWRATLFLRETSQTARGWLLAVMGAVEAVGWSEFTPDQVYAQEARLAALSPGNRNVRPKIRQQLQVLRNRGWLAFDGRAKYRRTT